MTDPWWANEARQVTLYRDDNRRVLPELASQSISAVVTDPPYELGFMGKAWDQSGITNDPAFWRAVLRVMKPGAHLLAFGGTRTAHRMACAIEDAGFEIRDTLCWLYGQGFPKSHNLDGDWDGWGTALKPAYEPIMLARAPLSGSTVAANMVCWGTGALHVNRGRLEAGRWPPNVVLSHTLWCDDICAADCPVALLDAQSGQTPAGGRFQRNNTARSAFGGHGVYGQAAGITDGKAWERDTGGASRFMYVAKASAAERSRGLPAEPPRLKLRADLTPEQRACVLAELAQNGVAL